MKIKTVVAHGIAARIGQFLYRVGKEPWGVWSGKLTKDQQVEAFGVYLGRGTIWVDGTNETLEMYNKVSFGQDTQLIRRIDCKVMQAIDNVNNGLLKNQLELWEDE